METLERLFPSYEKARQFAIDILTKEPYIAGIRIAKKKYSPDWCVRYCYYAESFKKKFNL